MVFWVYGIVGGILLQILMGLLVGIGGFVGVGLAALLLIPYGIWSCVSNWRCAWNAGAKIWGIIVRVLVVISIPGYLFAVVGLFGAAALGGAATMAVPAAPIETPAMEQPMSVAPAPMAPETPMSVVPMGSPGDSMAAPAAPVAPMATMGSSDPAAPAPLAPVAAPAAPAPAPAIDACEQRMTDFAVQNKADPKAYIAQNQTYLAQCRAALAGQAKP